MTENDFSQQIAVVVDRATELALQADAAAAAEALASLLHPSHDSDLATFHHGMIRRFGPGATAAYEMGLEDTWIAELVKHYVTYWHSVLTKQQSLEVAEIELQAALNTFLGQSDSDFD